MLVDQLKRDEGFRSTVYTCPAGRNTVGYGHNLDDNPLSKAEIKYLFGKELHPDVAFERLCIQGINQKQATWLLERDIAKVQAALLLHYPWMSDLDSARFDAVCNMAFQLGVKGVSKFKHMLRALEMGCYDTAADEALDSRWAKQTPERAQRVALQMRLGEVV